MRHIAFDKIVQTVKSLCIEAAYELPDDIIDALKKAVVKETGKRAAKILNQLIENAHIAKTEHIPLCQDTGLAVVFIEQGTNVIVDAPSEDSGPTIIDAVNAGVKAGYQAGYLRKSVVTDPLFERTNTGSNTPAIVHFYSVPGEKIKITIMTKGGGCENKSRFRMFKPTSTHDEIVKWIVDVVVSAGADACPPFIVGVGIGGDFELCTLLSKKALLRPLGQQNPAESYAGLEQYLLKAINALNIGPQGLGGDTTALAVSVETAPCHIASLPVAVNIDCHSHRHKSAII
ncbi:MAG: fumarate hydratase [Sedimentisphaerales bacterium]|nr:fumarate hydratase [Sedimentisphaerales bacterium]